MARPAQLAMIAPAPEELIGAWRLRSFRDGAATEDPLGPAPDGFLIYTPDGHVTVSMMRTTPGQPLFLGYAGHWYLRDDMLHHRILVCSRADWIGLEQSRTAILTADTLTVHAPHSPTRSLTWRRIRR